MNSDDLFFMGRGFDYALSLEGSLKLKEISYVHSEAYAAGELKHGTISLIVNGTPGRRACHAKKCVRKNPQQCEGSKNPRRPRYPAVQGKCTRTGGCRGFCCPPS